MATHESTLHELCYPGVPYDPWKHISSPPPTSRPTLQELCYPDITYVRQNKSKSSLRLREQLNTNS